MNRGKTRTTFVCQECGAQAPKWEGRCPQCGQWNALVETAQPSRTRREPWLETTADVQELSQVSLDPEPRFGTGFQEMDRVLGGGFVPGSLVLLAGEPGIGKSTLLLQVFDSLARRGHKLLYISGEESAKQVRLRAQRMSVLGEGMFFLGETDVDRLLAHMESLQPFLVVVDSVQTLYSQDVSSTTGSVAQIRECTRQLMQWAKGHNVPVLLAGHVTKDGSVAGPRVLEHMVDVVLYLEGDTFGPYRILRAAKNRFGSTNEIGVFQMGQKGLEEVKDPSELFLSSRRQDVPGSVVTVTMEGTRPLLVEVQALTTPTVFAQPRRTATSVDFQRLLLVAAASSKRLGIPLGDQDIIVNVPGGLHVAEPSVDLAIAIALISSFRNLPCDPWTVVIGEVGLGGELRSVPQLGRRLSEAAKMGFRKAVVPEAQANDAQGNNINVAAVPTLGAAVRRILPSTRHATTKGDGISSLSAEPPVEEAPLFLEELEKS
jgi:DNA repair protein RadA/Sms